MSSDRAPPERPAGESDDASDDTASDDHPGLSNITTTPGDRYTENVEMLVIEAEFAHNGKQIDNPAKIPAYADETAAEFAQRLEQHDDDLVPAWTRPWEGGDE